MNKKVIFILIVLLAFIVGTQIIVWSNITGDDGTVGIMKGLIIAILSMVVGALIMYLITEKTPAVEESVKKYVKDAVESIEKTITEYKDKGNIKESEEDKVKNLKSKREITLGTLVGDEYAIYKEIFDNEGKLLQKNIIEKTGFSNAKVTRVLDVLERKNIVERKRDGMSNIVILK
ncbi:MAG: hypothetical protein BWK75_00665 [Candidatus Altiarchaeales archaeon A3]|nr:MAG: hypothetical protein BWK75_00665 [Candidatus Altiarchaeales archaeon A3]